jgi:hypothetical protein
MKTLIRLMLLGAVVTTFAWPAFAQDTKASPTPSPSPSPGAAVTTQQQEDPEAKAALYKRFTDNYKTNQAVANEAAKEYLEKYPNDDPKIIAYLKDFVSKYEKGSRKGQLDTLVRDKKFDEAFKLGKEVLASQPDDLPTLLATAWSGLNLATTGKDANNVEATNYARKAIQLIEAGKTPEEGKPFAAKDETLGWLNYALGIFSLKNNPTEATNSLIKAAQYEGFVKKDPQTYALLAIAYQAGQYNKLRDDFKTRFEGKPESPESKAALETLNQVMDRIIDAYARAVALSGTDAKYAAKKTEWMKQLTDFYKFRNHDSEAGLNELIAGVLSKPLPQPATITTTPTTTPTTNTTPATGAGNSSTGATNTNTGTGATDTTPASTTQPTTTQPTTTQPSGGNTTPTQPNKQTQPSGNTTTTPTESKPTTPTKKP